MGNDENLLRAHAKAMDWALDRIASASAKAIADKEDKKLTDAYDRLNAHTDRDARPWDLETIGEHIHTAATMQQEIRRNPSSQGRTLKCLHDLGAKLNADGLATASTPQFTATLLTSGAAIVTRREGE